MNKAGVPSRDMNRLDNQMPLDLAYVNCVIIYTTIYGDWSNIGRQNTRIYGVPYSLLFIITVKPPI